VSNPIVRWLQGGQRSVFPTLYRAAEEVGYAYTRATHFPGPQRLVLPAGKTHKTLVNSSLSKIPLYRNSDYTYVASIPAHERGGLTSSRTAGRDAVDAGSVGARGEVQGGQRIEPNPVSASRRVTNDAAAYGETVWSWLSLLQSSRAEVHRANRMSMHRQFARRR